jgi:uncharacterized membrane protein YdjX (TVP38/TMEM64 family)
MDSSHNPETLRRRIVPLGLVVAGIAAVWLVARHMGFDLDFVRVQAERAGALGAVVFGLLFAGALLVGVPGVALIGVGVAVFGPVLGAVLSLVGGLTGMSLSFLLVRLAGAPSITPARWRRSEMILRRIEVRPLQTVAVLRVVFQLSQPVTYALAMTGIAYRDFLIGSMLGLVPTVAAFAIAFRALG